MQMQGADRYFQRLNPLTGEVASRALAMTPAAAQEVAKDVIAFGTGCIHSPSVSQDLP